jgi:type III restriction enzyme
VSSIKKRQEIGRGLRLCVDQEGNRPDGMNLNILTVIANESYESYVENLQKNYVEDGETAPPAPKTPEKGEAIRRDDLFVLDAFKAFWHSLSHRLSYRITIDTPTLVIDAIKLMNDPKRTQFPQPVLTVSRGRYVVTDYVLRVESAAYTHVDGRPTATNWAKVILESKDTRGKISDLGLIPMDSHTFVLSEKDDLYQKTNRNPHLRGFKVARVWKEGGEARVKFENEVEISESEKYRFQETGTKPDNDFDRVIATADHPINDFLARAVQVTNLTRATITEVFLGILETERAKLFKNPEGWTNVFITTLKDALADHIADRVEFFNKHLEPLDENDFFPPMVNHAQRELIDGGPKSLYDKVQVDSTTVEIPFVEHSLRDDENNIVFYFKFPGKFKLGLPKIIGNYNPDWGIVRIAPNGAGKVQLVRETKGSDDLESLRFHSEGRKLIAAKKYFAALGIDYRWVTGETPQYWDAK